jgi:hypothetical protein
MGFFRGGLFVIFSVLFFVSLLIGNTLLILSLSLDYDVVKPEITSVINEIIEKDNGFENKIKEIYPAMELYCFDNSEFVFSNQGQTFRISCEAILQGQDFAMKEGINNLVYDIYYKKYDCVFWNCLGKQELPFFLVSEKAKDYWSMKFYYLILISLGILFLMFLFIENKTNLPLVLGSLCIISSLPFIKLKSLVSYFLNKPFFEFFTIFFNKSYFVFLIVLIIGIIIFCFGIVLKFFKIGFKINELIKKFSKKSSVNSKEISSVKDINIKNSVKKTKRKRLEIFSTSKNIIDKKEKLSKSVAKK